MILLCSVMMLFCDAAVAFFHCPSVLVLVSWSSVLVTYLSALVLVSAR
jgi:hypothetical protein